MEIDKEKFDDMTELMRIHTSVLTKLVNDNENIKLQLCELLKDRIRDKLIFKAAITSIIDNLNNKCIMDSQQFIASLKDQIMEDKPIFDELGIDIEKILEGDSMESSFDSSIKSKKHKVKVKNGIINFKDYKKDN